MTSATVSAHEENETRSPSKIEEVQDDGCSGANATIAKPTHQFSWGRPTRVCSVSRAFQPSPYDTLNKSNNNFTKGVKFSPDGLCVLSNSEDASLRMFEVSSILDTAGKNSSDCQAALLNCEAGTIYDFQWFPFMTSNDPTSCFYISTSQDSPIHLWDAYTGDLRASYRGYNHLDEITAAYSVCINTIGTKIYAGYDRTIRTFDLARPGRSFEERPLSKTRKSRIYDQRGIISTLHFNPDYSGMYAAGSYYGSVCIYAEETGEKLLGLDGHCGGVTQVQFSKDGLYLYSGARKDGAILCWDIRKTTGVLNRFERTSMSNQRIQFDVHPSGKYVMTGCQSGQVHVYDTITGQNITSVIGFKDCVNGLSIHPCETSKLQFVLSTGQRHHTLPDDMDDSDRSHIDAASASDRNTIQLWEFPPFDG